MYPTGKTHAEINGDSMQGARADSHLGPAQAVEVSVVVPTFRRPEMLRGAVESVLAQKSLTIPMEVIVVDNDPQRSAEHMVENLAQRGLTSVHYLCEARAGISHARNAGVAASRGRYIAFLDDDEVACPRRRRPSMPTSSSGRWYRGLPIPRPSPATRRGNTIAMPRWPRVLPSPGSRSAMPCSIVAAASRLLSPSTCGSACRAARTPFSWLGCGSRGGGWYGARRRW